jgi:hypothetical protein
MVVRTRVITGVAWRRCTSKQASSPARASGADPSETSAKACDEIPFPESVVASDFPLDKWNPIPAPFDHRQHLL